MSQVRKLTAQVDAYVAQCHLADAPILMAGDFNGRYRTPAPIQGRMPAVIHVGRLGAGVVAIFGPIDLWASNADQVRVGGVFVGFSDDAVVKHLLDLGYASLFERVGGRERAPVTHLTHRNEEVGWVWVGGEDVWEYGCNFSCSCKGC